MNERFTHSCLFWVEKMKKILVLLVLALSLSGCTMNYYTKTFNGYMDTVTTYITYASSQSDFDKQCDYIEKRLNYYDHLFDAYHKRSVNNIYTINQKANKKAIKVDDDLYDLLNISIKRYNTISDEVNLAMGAVTDLYQKARNKALSNNGVATPPSASALKKAGKTALMSHIVLNKKKQTVYVKGQTKLDVGAVAKGYAMEKIKKGLIKRGVSTFLLNGGGNVVSYGKRATAYDQASYLKECKEKYCVGIASPQDGNFDDGQDYEAVLVAAGTSIVTSGDYQRYFKDKKGKRYCHLISPKTFTPGRAMRSVSVVTKDSSLADFLSTALFLMGYKKGKALVEKTKGVEAIWLLNDGSIKYSSGLKDGTHFYVIEKSRLK